MMRFALIALTWLSLITPAYASTTDTLNTILKELPESASSALLVVDAKTGKSLYSYNAKHLYPPASVQKMLTALAAKTVLAGDFRYQTSIEKKGKDIIIQFGGDPTLSRDDLHQLLTELKTKVSVIEGNLYINGSFFDRFELADGLPQDNLGVCYSAPSSSITLDGNCVSAKMYYPENSNKLHISKSASKPITVYPDLQVKTISPGDSPCYPKLLLEPRNFYRIGGCIGKNQIPKFFNFAVQDTSVYAGNVIMQELNTLGIKLNGKIIRNDSISGELLVRHQSDTLDNLIQVMLEDSVNLIADNLIKTIGRYYYSEPGGYANGVAAVKAIMKKHYDIDLSGAEIADGSGLSRNNRLSSHIIMQVINQIYHHPELGIKDRLAVAGKSGTLLYRYSLQGDTMKGRVHGKSGTLYGTYNLAGWIKSSRGKDIFFVQMVTHYHQGAEANPKASIRRFEKKLYNALYTYF